MPALDSKSRAGCKLQPDTLGCTNSVTPRMETPNRRKLSLYAGYANGQSLDFRLLGTCTEFLPTIMNSMRYSRNMRKKLTIEEGVYCIHFEFHRAFHSVSVDPALNG